MGLTITGKVVEDESFRPLENVELTLMYKDIDIANTNSNNDGYFQFEISIENANCIVKASMDQYEISTIEIEIGDISKQIDQIVLHKVNELNEVEVTADNIVIADGNLLFNPTPVSIKSSSYAIDLISKLGIPNLEYNPLNRSISCDDASPVILIDGIPSSQDDLKNIKSSEVLNVEYSNFVPMKYSNYGSNAVINVRLKKRNNGGSWNIWEMNDFTGNAVDVNTGFNFYQGVSRLSMGGYFSYRNNDKTYDKSVCKYNNSSLPIDYQQFDYAPFNYKASNAAIQYCYVPSSSCLLLLKYNFNNYNTLRKEFNEIRDNKIGEYDGFNRYHRNAPTHNVDMYFSYDINSKNSIDVNFIYNNVVADVNNYQIYNKRPNNEEYVYDLNSKRNAFLGGIDYGHKFSNDTQLDIYYGVTISDNKNFYRYRNSKFISREFNNLAFVQFKGSLSKYIWIFAKTGLNAERIREGGIQRIFVSNLSNLNLQWNISSKWIFSYQGRFHTNSAALSLYDNTFVQYNSYLYNTGNTEINPSKNLNNTVTVMYRHKIFNINLSGRFNHVISPIVTVTEYNNDLKAYVSTPTNGKNSNSFSIVASANFPQLFNMFSINGGIAYIHSDNTLSSGWKYNMNAVGGTIDVSWQHKNFTIGYSRSFPLKYLNNLRVSYENEPYDSLWLRYTPNQHWQIQCQWEYMFSKRGWYSKTYTVSPEYYYKSERQIRNDKNWIRLSVSYNVSFGTPPKTKDKQRMLQINDSQSIYNDYSE